MSARQLTGTHASVPFLDLAPSHSSLKADLLADIADLLDSSAFTNGPHVERFEEAFAEYCGVAECVGVASGLDALRLGLIASGLRLTFYQEEHIDLEDAFMRLTQGIVS